ncbi:MAG: TIGR01777 family oxidoreductase, partial [Verrucomicrobiota bacterium]|nr:TIGR01777 family oxidoreductase [Verrucomicrobiota bacterium]
MKIVIPGGSGLLGTMLARSFNRDGHDVVILTRKPRPVPWRMAAWDAQTLGNWTTEFEGADAVINLAGRSVNCRFTQKNRRAIMDSRVNSTRAVGRAIAQAANPPRIWLQAGTATIYAHRYDASNDEFCGVIASAETDAPETWQFSLGVAKAWENAMEESATPRTRKVVLRISMIMSPDGGSVFDVLLGLVRHGLGGRAGDGRQFVSWIHCEDFVRAIYWLLAHVELAGPVNLTSPGPVSNEEFMRAIREARGASFGLPAARWMLEIGAFFMRT